MLFILNFGLHFLDNGVFYNVYRHTRMMCTCVYVCMHICAHKYMCLCT